MNATTMLERFSRLTANNYLGLVDLPETCESICKKYANVDCTECPLGHALSRLTEYEESGLSPAEVRRMKDETDYGENKVLTINELQKLGDRPVWVIDKTTNRGEWMVCSTTSSAGKVYISFKSFSNVPAILCDRKDYYERWQAYKYKF